MTAFSPLPTPIPADRAFVTGSGGLSWDELRRKATRRIAERVDPARNRHKPLSILRQESKRAIDLFFEAEFPYIPKDDRVKLTDEVLSEAVGLGPLEELFRDDAVREILILGPSQVIVCKDDNWVPTSVFFRDVAHVRQVLLRTVEQGEPIHPGQTLKACVDVKLANGFRAVGIIPPDVMETLPLIAFVRWFGSSTGVTTASESRTANPGTPNPSSQPTAILTTPAPRGGSGLISTPAPRSAAYATSRSGVGLLGGSKAVSDSNANSPVHATPAARTSAIGVDGPASGIFGNDPYAKMRGKITQRLITKIASAGIYDLSQIPKHELKKIVATMVDEANANDRLNLDASESARLTLEIISGMQV